MSNVIVIPATAKEEKKGESKKYTCSMQKKKESLLKNK